MESEHERIMRRLDEIEVLILDLHGKKEPLQPQPEYLSVGEACQLLGVSKQTLYNLTSTQAIPFLKQKNGKLLRFKRHDLINWMEGGRRGSASIN